MSRRGLIWQVMEYRVVPFQGPTDALGLIRIPIDPPFTDLKSIVPIGCGEIYKGRPVLPSVVEVALDHVILKFWRTKAPVATVLGAVVEQFEVAFATNVFVVIRGK